jgi:hypothetical protein
MYNMPTVPSPGGYHQRKQQQVPPPPPSPPPPQHGPYDPGNWQLKWRKRTRYDANGFYIGAEIEQEATYLPPYLQPNQLQQPQKAQTSKLWVIVAIFVGAPLAIPTLIVGLMVLGVLASVLQQLWPAILVILLVLLLVYGLVRKRRRP